MSDFGNQSGDPFRLLRDSRATWELLAYPEAFALLTQIVLRARRSDGLGLDGLSVGQARIGDYRIIGLTERKYRTAKALLEKAQIATFKATNKGTIATLVSSAVYDLQASATDEQTDEQATNKRRASDEQATTNHKGIREKERRILCPEQAEPAPDGAELSPPSPTFLTIPLIQRDGEFAITEDMVADYRQTFPAVDVQQALRECRQWSIDNPKRRKTRGGIRKHINGWLSRRQNCARPDGASHGAQPTGKLI